MNHRLRSQFRGRTHTRCVRALVCALGARHELYMSCAPASLCRPHAAHCSLLPPRSEEACARHVRGVGCMQRRSTTLLCALYWSRYSREHLSVTCLLPAAAKLLRLLLLLFPHALADAQHLLDLEAIASACAAHSAQQLTEQRPAQPRVLASRGVLALRGRAAGTACARSHGHSIATAHVPLEKPARA